MRKPKPPLQQKKWFHGTTLEGWRQIKEAGVLWGISRDYPGRRLTFLANNLSELERWIYSPMAWGDMRKMRGGLILSVKYAPTVNDEFNGFELITRQPIPLQNLKVHKYLGTM